MYNGFKQETFAFLDQLAMNNSKGWFEAHKLEYLEYLKRPFYELVEALAPAMKRFDQDLDTDPKHSVARINAMFGSPRTKPIPHQLWRHLSGWCGMEGRTGFFFLRYFRITIGMAGIFCKPRPYRADTPAAAAAKRPL